MSISVDILECAFLVKEDFDISSGESADNKNVLKKLFRNETFSIGELKVLSSVKINADTI